MTEFGHNLRNIRLSRGYTQEKFAEMIDSNQASITAWEKGTRMPPLQKIKEIAVKLNVPLSALISIAQSGEQDDFVAEVSDLLHNNPKLRLLFDKTKYMNPQDLDVVLSVVSAISKEREFNG